MKIALDTSAYIAACEKAGSLLDVLAMAEVIALPCPVVGELLAGIRGSKAPDHKARIFTRFLQQPGVRVLYPDFRTCELYAELAQQLATAGTPIPINDIWIAALTLQYDLALCTRDKHFARLPQVRRV